MAIILSIKTVFLKKVAIFLTGHMFTAITNFSNDKWFFSYTPYLVLIRNEGLKTWIYLNSWSHINLRPDLHYFCSILRTSFISTPPPFILCQSPTLFAKMHLNVIFINFFSSCFEALDAIELVFRSNQLTYMQMINSPICT